MNDMTQPVAASVANSATPSATPAATQSATRKRWSQAEVEALYALPFNDLMFQAQNVHRANFDPNAVQLSTLLSIKTGGCSEDCGYCSQSARHDTGLEREKLLNIAEVVATAKAAKEAGATRFCMGAAWRGPKEKDLGAVTEMVREVKALGLETCVTLGMLKPGQAEQLKDAGLDYYNHNLDTASEFYGQVITTHTHGDRLDTLAQVRDAGIHVCCGGIIGMGESRRVRAGLVLELANLDPQPESVPINMLVKVPGTPLADVVEQSGDLDPLEFVRTIAVARITMPASHVRLSAGRQELGEGVQALCFLAGANSVFYGDKLLTTGNPDVSSDAALFAKLGLTTEPVKGRRCAGH
jgi:biotin synthase